MNRKRSRLISLVVVLVVVAGVWSVWGVEKAEAIIVICKTPLFGITRGETARSYVVNFGDENGVIAIIRYLDIAGNVLAESGELRVAIGQGTFFEMNGDDLNFGNAQRIPVRVEISINDPNLKKFPKDVDVSSVEIFESSSGRTLSIVGLPFIEQ